MDLARARATRLFSRRSRRTLAGRRRTSIAAVTAVTVAAGLVPTAGLVALSAPAHGAPVGMGFNLNAADLRFILDQIKIAEQHAANFNPNDPCAGLVGSGANQIPEGPNSRELPWGLRTVDGSCNNLQTGQEKYGAADQVFPRRAGSSYLAGEPATFDTDGPGPMTVGGPTSYDSMSTDVFDSQPRVISNLIVDQTANNPAAVAAAGPDAPVDPATGSLFIPNVAPDTGLSAPFNSVFTLFGQFFDHGLDLVAKGGHGTVYMPLKDDDPLVAGRDGIFGNADDLPARMRFMALTRATLVPGTREAMNLTTPFVDQNQTYSSHPAHQVFLREYALNAAGKPVATGQLLEGSAGGQATWQDVKDQARQMLGIQLSDADVLNVPLLATDPYGNFLPNPATGFPLVVTSAGERSGTPAAPISTDNAMRTGHAFLDDIAHHAVPDIYDDHNPGTANLPKTADTDTTSTTDDRNPSTYDDEMLNAHFVAGDGRVNENIGLTAIHHVFHSEHNRLAGDQAVPGSIKNVLVNEDPDMVSQWQLADGSWNGERIFQAAKFVTEMEYQHLVFEEFARKVQPMINAFGEGGTGYNTSINPAIRAEFAHAVYRFGHSMLTETMARRNSQANGATRNDVGLIQAFLNPQEFTNGGPAGTLDADEAAGSIFRGMSRQVGNEIDEFVTGALRSNLLGLPLDLAAINLARARETGVPSLNATRRMFYADSNNGAVRPYQSWADFDLGLRNRESLVNFVAAYGTHDLITGATTAAAKRDAAMAIVYGPEGPDGVLSDVEGTPEDESADNPTATAPADRLAFINSTAGTQWANAANGVTTTGVDRIDLWMGGLAEKQMVFGGLLGSTFNYVFELQMEDLQFGDRFYYLSRTAGLNLLTQLEGNSFAELVMRNTDVDGLPADTFSRPDYLFNVGNLGTGGPITDDPTTEDYNEGDRSSEPGSDLGRTPNGTGVRYSGPAHVVFNGTADADRVWSSEGDDTVRGNDGDDWMQGGDGVDNLVGGLGDDILEDLFGDDTLKGGDGDDALSSGQGFGGDLNQGGRGRDFILNGNDLTEAFAGPGNDFVLGGDDMDTVFGDDGNDWLEAGGGPFNLLQGDNGNPFQNDPDGGHDVLDGDGGEQDFDAEGGDDIMLLGPGIQRAEGMLGFDWATHQGDPQAGDSDLLFTGLLPPSVSALRDRFDLVEGLSGWRHDDVLRGDGIPPAPVSPGPDADGEAETPEGPEGEIVDPALHTLDQDGINRIAGLAGVLPAGTTQFSGGNIILGGGGNDTIEGRAGDDVIDGDAWLNVQLRAPNTATLDPNDSVLVDSMRDLQNQVFAGDLDPGEVSIVRRIERAAPESSRDDAAMFSDLRQNYDCTVNGVAPQVGELCPLQLDPGATVRVVHAAGTLADGTDTLTNIEHLVFADTAPPAAPTIRDASPHNSSATVRWTPPTRGVVHRYVVRVTDAAGRPIREVQPPVAAPADRLRVTGLENGTAYRFQVRAENAAGTSAFSGLSNAVTPADTEPESPTIGTAVAADGQVTVRWTRPADDGGSDIQEFRVTVKDAVGTTADRVLTAPGTATQLTVTGLTNGEQYWFDVVAVNSIGESLPSGECTATPATAPGAPQVGTARARDRAAVVRWTAPANTGGLAISGYRIRVVDRAGNRVGPDRLANAVTFQTVVGGLTNGETYRFRVSAVNEMGVGRFSRASNAVTPGTRPDAPVIRRARAGAAGGQPTATARWSPPATATLPAVTAYRVTALQVPSRTDSVTVLRRYRSPVLSPSRRTFRFVVPNGLYRFQVVAYNAFGRSPASRESNAVRAR